MALRETSLDRQKQTRLFEVFSEKMNMSFNQFSSKSFKYRIDGYLYKDKIIKGWVECKWYSNKALLFINVPKYQELVNLSEMTGVPSYLLFREGDKWGVIIIHDGKNRVAKYEVKLLGGTPVNRVKNPDDIEPLMVLDRKQIRWGN